MARTKRLPRIAPRERIYAIGDVHGRFDLFVRLIGLIRQDAEAREPRKTRIILIGDLVDRGPDSAALVDRLRALQQSGMGIVVLKGNHEQIMVSSLRGDVDAFGHWLRFGGDATLRSWGFPEAAFDRPLPEQLAAAQAVVPGEAIDWLDALPLSVRSRDFFFVHAGIRPGVPLRHQHPADMLWISSEFLFEEGPHPAMIVHGHTIVEDGPKLLSNRIGLDTGAYRTGRLSAVAFEDDRQWTIST